MTVHPTLAISDRLTRAVAEQIVNAASAEVWAETVRVAGVFRHRGYSDIHGRVQSSIDLERAYPKREAHHDRFALAWVYGMTATGEWISVSIDYWLNSGLVATNREIE